MNIEQIAEIAKSINNHEKCNVDNKVLERQYLTAAVAAFNAHEANGGEKYFEYQTAIINFQKELNNGSNKL